jgi:hypothetical protein
MPTPETALKVQLRCKTGNPKSPTLCIRDEWPAPSSLSELFQCRVCVLEFIWSEEAAAIFRIITEARENSVEMLMRETIYLV